MKTKVIFRTFRDASREAIALFPELPHDVNGFQCVSYMHTGQHGGASPQLIRVTRPATPEESEPLAAELARIGYVLEERKKISYAMDRARMDAAKSN